MSTISPAKKSKRKSSPKKRFLVEETNTFVYKISKFDKDGWACAEKYKPMPYAMVVLLTEDGKEKNGWWGGFGWEGYRVRRRDKIVKWKRYYYGESCWGDK